MPRLINRLTDVDCRHAKKTVYDGGGLHLYVDLEGAKYWRLKYSHLQRERLAGGGRYPDISLAKARAWRDDFRDALRARRDPIADKYAAIEADKIDRAKADTDAANTLERFATKYHAVVAKSFRNSKHRAQWLASLRPVFDALGAKPLAAITEADVLDVLTPIIADTPETGRRVKQRLRAVFDAAKLRKLVPYNVVRELAGAAELKTPSRNDKHLPAMAHADVPAFLADLRAFERASAAVKLCLEFLMLTATRSGEARGALWSEVDETAKLWTIPAERTKRNREHVVPLSRAALAVLKQAHELAGGELVFPSPMNPDVELSDMALSMTMRRMDRQEVPHGFQSSFAGWARTCTRIRDEAIERALAHVEQDKTKAAYMRSDFLDERRKLIDGWGGFVTSPPSQGKVVPFERNRAS